MTAPLHLHGIGGPAVRRLEKRYTAAALTAYALVGAVTIFWVMLARTMPGGSERAVLQHGTWYLVVAALPVVIVVASRSLVARGLLGWVWGCAAAMALVPMVFFAVAVVTGQPQSEVSGLAQISTFALLLVPLLVAAAVVGRDAMWAPVAALAAVVAIAVVRALEGDAVWGLLVWLPTLGCVLVGGFALARRNVLAAWGAAFAALLSPVVVAGVSVVFVGVDRASGLLFASGWLLPATAVLFAAAWRETTDPLVGIFALSPSELRIHPSRREARRGDLGALPSDPAHEVQAESVEASDRRQPPRR